MHLLDLALIITTLAALYGAYLVSSMNVIGFYIWCVTNAIFAAHNMMIEQYAMSALFVAYEGLAILGIYNSEKNKMDDIPENEMDDIPENEIFKEVRLKLHFVSGKNKNICISQKSYLKLIDCLKRKWSSTTLLTDEYVINFSQVTHFTVNFKE